MRGKLSAVPWVSSMSPFQPSCELDGVDREAEELGVALVEVGLARREGAQLGRADRCEVLRVREEDAPAVAEVVVEAERALGGLGGEVRGLVAQVEVPSCAPCVGVSAAQCSEGLPPFASVMRIGFGLAFGPAVVQRRARLPLPWHDRCRRRARRVAAFDLDGTLTEGGIASSLADRRRGLVGRHAAPSCATRTPCSRGADPLRRPRRTRPKSSSSGPCSRAGRSMRSARSRPPSPSSTSSAPCGPTSRPGSTGTWTRATWSWSSRPHPPSTSRGSPSRSARTARPRPSSRSGPRRRSPAATRGRNCRGRGEAAQGA